MPQADHDDEFERHRRRLEGLAYRMCGVLADAQDIVQETHLRWSATPRSSIRNAQAWLVRVCSRLAIDTMKSARSRRENYVGTWLPEPHLETDWNNPERQAEIDDSVSMALMVAMEQLSPAERAAFILHDIFGYAFEEIAEHLERSEAACRKLASRARVAVRNHRPKPSCDPQEHKRLLTAFFDAAHSGSQSQLVALLRDSVELHADGGGKVTTAPQILEGPLAVADFFQRIWRAQAPTRDSIQIIDHWFNGSPGAVIYQREQLVVAISLAIEDGKIARIFALRNPDKLRVFHA